MKPRTGLALPLALAGIVLIGILAASGLFLASQERRAGESASLSDRSLAAAELGLGKAIADWDPVAATALGWGERLTQPATAPAGDAAVSLTRLGERVFWVVSEGRAQRGSTWARRRLNLVLRIAVPPIVPRAAMTVAGEAAIGTAARVSGIPGPACEATGEARRPIAGIMVASAGDASGDLSGVQGDPAILPDSAGVARATSLFAPGSPTYDVLVQRASIALAGGVSPPPSRPALSGEGCDLTRATNWGEPRLAGGLPQCARYFPVVHARGDLRLEGDHRGQGILLVDGTLAIPGSLEYRGLILVRGNLDAPGRLRLTGAAIVRGSGGAPSVLGAGSDVEYGPCAIERALTGAGRPVSARERGWGDLF